MEIQVKQMEEIFSNEKQESEFLGKKCMELEQRIEIEQEKNKDMESEMLMKENHYR